MLKFNEYSEENSTFIKIKEENAIGHIELREEDCMLSIGGGCATLAFESVKDDEFKVDQLIIDIHFGLAILLYSEGYEAAAAGIFRKNYNGTSFLKNDNFVFDILKCYYDAHYWDDIEEAFTWLRKQKRHHNACRMFLFQFYRNYRRDSEQERDLVEKLYLLDLEFSIEAADETLIGSSFYNLGNFYRSIGETLKAVKNYNSARKIDVIYEYRGYFWRELGELFFGIEKRTWAKTAYLKAVTFGDDIDARAKYADCLLYEGKYSEALKEFQVYCAEHEFTPNGWLLKLECLEKFVENYAIKDGVRDSIKSNELAYKQPHKKEHFVKAVNLDLMNAGAWFNFGVTLSSVTKEPDEALWAFLWAALTCPNDVEAWVNSFFLSFNLGQSKEDSLLAVTIFTEAYQFNRSGFIELAFKFADTNPSIKDEDREGLKQGLMAMANEISGGKRFDFRLLGPDRELSTFSV